MSYKKIFLFLFFFSVSLFCQKSASADLWLLNGSFLTPRDLNFHLGIGTTNDIGILNVNQIGGDYSYGILSKVATSLGKGLAIQQGSTENITLYGSGSGSFMGDLSLGFNTLPGDAKLNIKSLDNRAGIIAEINYSYGFGYGILGKYNQPFTKALAIQNKNASNVYVETMVIYANGQAQFAGPIGIGCTPYAGTKLAVNGMIRTTEVLVMNDNTYINFPDYVFNNSYQLLPLAKLEQFIKNEKHLPEIPTAKEVQKDGIELGKLQMKLLQKVEELTLYLINQDKEIKELKKDNTYLKSIISSHKATVKKNGN